MARHNKIIGISVAIALIATPAAAWAQGQFNFLSVVTDNCRTCGACSLCDLMLVLTKGMRFMLSLAGALALAMFIWGGWTLLLSGGKSEAVELGKKVITGTVVGLTIILLLAWIWPNLVIVALKGVPSSGAQTIFNNDAWWVTPCVKYAGQQCTTEPKRVSEEFANVGDSGCETADASGSIVKKAVGAECAAGGGLCKESPCACNAQGICVPACVPGEAGNQSCLDRDLEKKQNYCRRVGQAGVCEAVSPGTSCKGVGDGMCVDYISATYNNVNIKVKMFCNFVGEDGVCRIQNGQRCVNKSDCAPASECATLSSGRRCQPRDCITHDNCLAPTVCNNDKKCERLVCYITAAAPLPEGTCPSGTKCVGGISSGFCER